AKNTKLKQDKEDIEARFAKLEQSDKEKTDLIAKLKYDISQIKQASVTSQSLISPSIKNHSGEVDSTDSVNLEQTQSAISSKVNSNNISEQTDDTSENAPNSDLQKKHSLESKTHQNLNLSLDNQNASSTELEKSMLLPLLCNANTVTNGHD
ncbi:19437_t:CDS:2, partial [Racocetra persica]